MATYDADFYALSKYGTPLAVDYGVDPFTAEPIGQGRIRVQWNNPTGSWTGFRLLGSRYGWATSASDGDILLDLTGPTTPGQYVDVDGPTPTLSAFRYYTLYLNISGTWQRAGMTSTLAVHGDNTLDTLLSFIPRYFRLASGHELTGNIENDDLKKFVAILAFGVDYLRSYAKTLPSANDPHVVHLSDLESLAAQFGVEYLHALPARLMRQRVTNASLLGKARGTLSGLRDLIGLSAGFDIEIVRGRNLMLTQDQSSFYSPVQYPDWDSARTYVGPSADGRPGDRVLFAGNEFEAKAGGATGVTQQPPNTAVDNTWWTYVNRHADLTLYNARTGGISTWSSRVDPPIANLVSNPDFDTDVSGWSAYTGLAAPTRSTDRPFRGTGRLAATGNNTNPLARVATTVSGLVAGEVVNVYTRVRSDGQTPTNAMLYLRPTNNGTEMAAATIEAAITNALTNPSFETNTTNWAAGPSVTLTREATDPTSGSYSLRCATTAVKAAATTLVYSNATSPSAAAPGDLWSAAVDVRLVSAPGSRTVRLGIACYDSGGTQLAYAGGNPGPPVQISSFDYTRVMVVSQATPANTASVRLVLLTGDTAWATGDVIRVDSASLINNSVSVGTYFDGSTLADGDYYTYSWTGTAHASTSVRTPAPKVTTSIEPTWAPDASGWMRVSATVTIPTGANGLKIIPGVRTTPNYTGTIGVDAVLAEKAVPNLSVNVGSSFDNHTGRNDSNVLAVKNTALDTRDLLVRSIGYPIGDATWDPELVVRHGIPVPQATEHWDADVEYVRGDIVLHRNRPWRALKAALGAQPPGEPDVDDVWEALGFDERIRMCFSAYAHGPLTGTAGSGGLAVESRVSLFDEHGQFLTTLNAKSTTAFLDTFTRRSTGVWTTRVADVRPATQTWSMVTGAAWNVADGLAYPTTPTAATITQITGLGANGRVAVTFGKGPLTGHFHGLALRISDSANMFRVSRISIVKVVAGVTTSLAGFASPFVDGDRLMVDLNGSTITVYKNGTQIAQVTDAFNSTVANHGMFHL